MIFLRSEDYFAEKKRVLTRVLQHIGVAPPADEAAWKPLLSGPPRVHGQRPKGGAPPMEAETKATLRAFYRPGLRELARQLADTPDAARWRAWAERDD